jgi:hypothetical protein
VADLLGALVVRRLVVAVELVVGGGRGGAGEHGPDEVQRGSGERAAGDADEKPDDDHKDVPGAVLGHGRRGFGADRETRVLGAADLDARGVERDGVEVVVLSVVLMVVRAEAADAEYGDTRDDLVMDGAVAARVGVGREGEEEGVARPRVGGEEGRGRDGQEQDHALGHGGGGGFEGKGEPWLGEMELEVDDYAAGPRRGENPRGGMCPLRRGSGALQSLSGPRVSGPLLYPLPFTRGCAF